MGIEIMTRLNAKTTSLTGAGGKAELSTADIAAALAGSNPIGLNVLIAKICGDSSVKPPLLRQIFQIVDAAARLHGWKAKKRRLHRLTQLAVLESCADQACPTCKGTGRRKTDPTKSCARCNGTGKYTLTASIKGKTLGVSKQAWSKTWQRRYDDIRILIDTYEYEAKRRIIRQLLD